VQAVSAARQLPRWPLFPIAAPAAVAVWSGWVGLGGMCGFGPVNLLPGIGGGFHVNTAITLPVGVEAYGAYALGAWLVPGTPERARTFARRSAVGALALGMVGQVVYHLLAAAGADRAPWPVVVLVACLPVVTLGFGAGLTHLLRTPGEATAPEAVPAGAPVIRTPGADLVPVPASAPEDVPGVPAPPASLNGHGHRGGRAVRRRPRGGERPDDPPYPGRDARRPAARPRGAHVPGDAHPGRAQHRPCPCGDAPAHRRDPPGRPGARYPVVHPRSGCSAPRKRAPGPGHSRR